MEYASEYSHPNLISRIIPFDISTLQFNIFTVQMGLNGCRYAEKHSGVHPYTHGISSIYSGLKKLS